MSYTFEDATPVTIPGTGAKKQPNPFKEIVAAIAWQTDKKTGKPVAKSFVEECGETDKEREALRNRIRRFMKDAGDSLETPGTVRTAFADLNKDGKVVDTKDENGKLVTGPVVATRVTFWVTKLITRTPKPKTDTEESKTDTK